MQKSGFVSRNEKYSLLQGQMLQKKCQRHLKRFERATIHQVSQGKAYEGDEACLNTKWKDK